MNEFVDSTAIDSAMETKQKAVVKNIDNTPLLPWGNENFVVGFVDEVNGRGAEEIPGFVPTKHELLQLVRYWFARVLDIVWDDFLFAEEDSYNSRLDPFARKRIRRAAAAIGHEAVDQAIKEVREDFKAKVNNPSLWEVFENGTAEQWRAVQDQVHRNACELPTCGHFETLEQLEKESEADFIAMVFMVQEGDKRCGTALFSHGNSELSATLQASFQFEFVDDRRHLLAVADRRHYTFMGFLSIARRTDELMFEFPCSAPGNERQQFLEDVAGTIKKLLLADTEKESQTA